MSPHRRLAILLALLTIITAGALWYFFCDSKTSHQSPSESSALPTLGLPMDARDTPSYGATTTREWSPLEADVTTGSAPLTITVYPTHAGMGDYVVDFGDGTVVPTECIVVKPEADACLEVGPITHTYTSLGTYVVNHYELGSTPAKILASLEVSVPPKSASSLVESQATSCNIALTVEGMNFTPDTCAYHIMISGQMCGDNRACDPTYAIIFSDSKKVGQDRPNNVAKAKVRMMSSKTGTYTWKNPDRSIAFESELQDGRYAVVHATGGTVTWDDKSHAFNLDISFSNGGRIRASGVLPVVMDYEL